MVGPGLRPRQVRGTAGLIARLWVGSENQLFHHLRNRHEFESFRFVPADEAIGRDYSLGTISAKPFVIAIVQQNQIAPTNLAADSALKVTCCSGRPRKTSRTSIIR